MENILEIRNLSKHYAGFSLKNINLTLPKGSIIGFVGENGAGKSTTIKLILNLIHRDSGDISVLGMDNIKEENRIKEDIGVVFDESSFPDNVRAADVSLIMKNIYKNWDNSLFCSYLQKFSLPAKKIVKEYSRGMKMKLAIAVALSHHARLLILDEATSGLDPVVREEILDIFFEFIQDEENAIFISSHIISDLEKIADYIALIHEGELLFMETKDQLLSDYGICKCSNADYERMDQNIVISSRKNQFGVEALVKKKDLQGDFTVDNASIEEIILFQIRGKVQ